MLKINPQFLIQAKNKRKLLRVMQGSLIVILILSWFLMPASPAVSDRAVCGTPGADGPGTITVANTIVNTYYPGTAVTLAAGSTSIPVGAPLPGGSTHPR